MKIYKIVRIIIPIFFLHLWACQPEEDMIQDESMLETEVDNYLLDAEVMDIQYDHRVAADESLCSAVSFEIPLISWPQTKTGTFTVNNSADYIIASFELDPDMLWDLQQTRLLIEVRETKNTPKKTFIKSKKYVYPVHHEKGTRSFTYKIPLSDLKLTKDKVDKCLLITGIANLDNKNFKRTKFAIAINDPDARSTWKSWLLEYCLSDCSQKIMDVSSIAWMDGIPYEYNTTETGYYEIFASEMENKYVDLLVIDEISGSRIKVGEIEILFWGANSVYDLFIEFQPLEGYDVLDAQIYVGILDPIRGPETYKNPLIFTDQNSLVFKMKVDFTPVYVAIAATIRNETI